MNPPNPNPSAHRALMYAVEAGLLTQAVAQRALTQYPGVGAAELIARMVSSGALAPESAERILRQSAALNPTRVATVADAQRTVQAGPSRQSNRKPTAAISGRAPVAAIEPPRDSRTLLLFEDALPRPAVSLALNLGPDSNVQLAETLPGSFNNSAGAPSAGAAATVSHTLPSDRVSAGQAALGRYEIHGELGKGGMGVVLRAFDKDLRRDVALKLVLDPKPDRERMLRFMEEGQVTGQLEHPNIVPVHELGLDAQNRLYFTMKMVRGASLKRRIDDARNNLTRRPLETEFPLRERLEIFLKVCDALAFAHFRGVIHRDLKSENVMVGEFGEVQVMDWGLAKIIGRPEIHGERLVFSDRKDGELRTMDGQVAGTPAYMPPEQARGDIETLDARADVYALGAMLYELLTLTPPYRGGTALDVLMQVHVGKLEAPSARVMSEYSSAGGGRGADPRSRRHAAVRPGTSVMTVGQVSVPRELEAVVLRAMAHEPRNRYVDVGELKADILRFLDGRTLAAAEYSPWELLVKFAKRNKAAVLGAMSTAAALVVGLAVIIWMAASAETQRLQTVALTKARAEADQRATLQTKAEELVARADRQIASATLTPFNPAAPQDYYEQWLSALTTLGQALHKHPQPPAEWKERLSSLAEQVQRNAQSIGDWAMAMHLAETVGAWEAADEATVKARKADVRKAQESAAAADRQRLADALKRIAEAEGLPSDGGGLTPGELQERARMLARSRTTPMAEGVLNALESNAPAHQGVNTRMLLIETLGRLGLVTVKSRRGVTAEEMVREALGRPADVNRTDETCVWIEAAARLKIRQPAALENLNALLKAAAEGFGPGSPVTDAVGRAHDYLAMGTKSAAALPNPNVDPVGFQRRVADLCDFVAESASSGSAYTAELLKRAGNLDRLTTAQSEFVVNQIGLNGDTLPPQMSAPEQTATMTLRAVYSHLPESWLADWTPSQVSEAEWSRRRRMAAAAALNLARLNDEWIARTLHWQHTHTAGREFWTATRLAVKLRPAPNDEQAEPNGAVEYYNRSVARHYRGDRAGALADASKAIAANPEWSLAFVLRAQLRIDAQDYRGALADFDTALRLAEADLRASPGDRDCTMAYVRVLNNRGGLKLDLRDIRGAWEDFRQSLQTDQTVADSWNGMGVVFERGGNWAEALRHYTRAIELNPRSDLMYVNRGNIYDNLRDFPRAIDDYTFALRLNPNNVSAYNGRGNTYRRREAEGDLRRALSDFDQALRLDPSWPNTYQNRGIVRQAMGDNKGALVDFTQATRRDPNNAFTWIKHGQVSEALGDKTTAMNDYNEAVRVGPQNALAYFQRGALRKELQDYAGSKSDFESALRANPNHWPAWVGLADVAQAKDPQAGLEYLLAAYRGAPRDAKEWIAERIRKIGGEVPR